MSRLSLGTAQFGSCYGIANSLGQVSAAEAKALLQVAAADDVNTLDTAIGYGEAEELLGKLGVQGFNVVTKLPALPDDCADVSGWVQEQVNASLSRLDITQIYGLLLHRPEQLLGANGSALYHALLALKDNRQVQKVGISIYSPTELDVLMPRYRFDLVQAPFNVIDQKLHRSGWMRRLKDDDIEIHTRSTFLQGLLLMPQADIPEKFSPWSDLWRVWHQWLLKNQVSAVQACLAFPLAYPEIDRIVLGVNSTSQLSEIMSAAKKPLPADLPDIYCDDENIIYPTNWNRL
jgi:aryl-alcohol dehydrogenase-like predicted oxidoreductase